MLQTLNTCQCRVSTIRRNVLMKKITRILVLRLEKVEEDTNIPWFHVFDRGSSLVDKIKSVFHSHHRLGSLKGRCWNINCSGYYLLPMEMHHHSQGSHMDVGMDFHYCSWVGFLLNQHRCIITTKVGLNCL